MHLKVKSMKLIPVFLTILTLFAVFAVSCNTTEPEISSSPDTGPKANLNIQEREPNAELNPEQQEAFRTDRFYSEPGQGPHQSERDRKIENVWEESRCKKFLSNCIATCKSAKVARFILLRFVFGEDDCETHCRAKNHCPLPEEK